MTTDRFTERAKALRERRLELEATITGAVDKIRSNLWNALKLGSAYTGPSGAPKPRIMVTEAVKKGEDFHVQVTHPESGAVAEVTCTYVDSGVIAAIAGVPGNFRINDDVAFDRFAEAIERVFFASIDQQG